jgi:Predicted methyltransferase regulatory domain
MLVDLADDNSIWKAVLVKEAVRLSKRSDGVTFHDELSASYPPVYFADFAAAAEQNGLQFVSDLRYQPRIVSGLATQATSRSALRPSRFPILASVTRSGSDVTAPTAWSSGSDSRRRGIHSAEEFLVDGAGP